MAEIRFREWTPDLPDLGNPGLIEATNLLPGSGAYIPQPSLTVASDALATQALGAFAAVDSSGNAVTYAGDAGDLYVLSGTNWIIVSASIDFSPGAGTLTLTGFNPTAVIT